MLLKSWRFLTVVLTALALTTTSAHVLELPQKMRYDAEMYAAVNTTLYRYFAVIGGAYYMGSLVAVGVLAFLLRRSRSRSAFRWTLVAAVLLVVSFASWLVLVAPVNSRVAAALGTAPETVPGVWMQLRDRWEYGHLTGFVLELFGFAALVVSVLVDTPAYATSGFESRHRSNT